MLVATTNIKRAKFSKPLLLLVAGYLILTGLVFKDYLRFASLSFIAGTMSVVLLSEKAERKVSHRYAIVSMIFLLLTIMAPVKTLLYFSMGFALFYLVESLKYRLNFSAVVSLFLITPVSEYAANVFSFPIRLQLSSWVGNILGQFSKESHATGNIIVHNGQEFSVDPACMGLNMLIASLLVGLMTIGFYQRKMQRRLRPVLVSLFLLSVITLNIFSNLSRMIVLVIFSIPPESLMHELTGLACLFLYVMVPVALLSKFIVNRFGKPATHSSQDFPNRINWTKQFLVFGLVVSAAVYVSYADSFSRFESLSDKKIHGYNLSLTQPGIVKLENDRSLIYVKFIRGFYDSDHNPTICWKGSGYEFTNVQQKKLAGYVLYTAILKKGKDQLHTAWWYSNGKDHTTDPFSWRYNAIRTGTTYAVVNVSAANERDLEIELNDVIQKNSLRDLFRMN
jgi:exosortase N